MLHRYSEVLNLPVICADSGKKAGVVKDILFSLKCRKMTALLLESKGFMPGRRAVLRSDLLRLGDNAVLIENAGCVSNINRKAYKENFEDEVRPLGLRVYSKDGGELGIVKDVIFDIQSGKIKGFEMSDGVLQDIIQGRRFLPLFGRVEFSEELAIVENEAVDEMEETGGGIRNRLP
jgi:uncharacterized protein YrrD